MIAYNDQTREELKQACLYPKEQDEPENLQRAYLSMLR